MNARDWTTLAMRVTWTVLIALTILPLISAIFQKLNILAGSFAVASTLSNVGSWTTEIKLLIQLGFGLYLLFGGKRFIRQLFRGIGSSEGLCPHCGYDVRGITSKRRPECGGHLRQS